MKKITPQTCRVIHNKRLDKQGAYFSLTLDNFRPPRKICPGQFVHLRVAGVTDPLFRRAFSIADFDPGTGRIEIIYKIVGRMTSLMGRLSKGDGVDILGPLGNHFARIPKRKTAILVAGGVGLPPLSFLAGEMIGRGHDPGKIEFFYGGRSRDDLIILSRLRALGMRIVFCTDDGSYGRRGLVTEAAGERMRELSAGSCTVVGCGPEPMLRVLQDMTTESGFAGEVSLEAPMPCGVGVCLGCVKATRRDPTHFVRVCYDGPVFKLGEIEI
jgi:dihydroorotate dehydrogenase electron transfer subunit